MCWIDTVRMGAGGHEFAHISQSTQQACYLRELRLVNRSRIVFIKCLEHAFDLGFVIDRKQASQAELFQGELPAATPPMSVIVSTVMSNRRADHGFDSGMLDTHPLPLTLIAENSVAMWSTSPPGVFLIAAFAGRDEHANMTALGKREGDCTSRHTNVSVRGGREDIPRNGAGSRKFASRRGSARNSQARRSRAPEACRCPCRSSQVTELFGTAVDPNERLELWSAV